MEARRDSIARETTCRSWFRRNLERVTGRGEDRSVVPCFFLDLGSWLAGGVRITGRGERGGRKSAGQEPSGKFSQHLMTSLAHDLRSFTRCKLPQKRLNGLITDLTESQDAIPTDKRGLLASQDGCDVLRNRSKTKITQCDGAGLAYSRIQIVPQSLNQRSRNSLRTNLAECDGGLLSHETDHVDVHHLPERLNGGGIAPLAQRKCRTPSDR
jgi:hypothetical protein